MGEEQARSLRCHGIWAGTCYGLNMMCMAPPAPEVLCPLFNSHIEILPANVMAGGGGPLGGNEVMRRVLSWLGLLPYRGGPRAPPRPSAMWGYGEKTAASAPGSRSNQIPSLLAPRPGLLAPRAVRNAFLLFASHPVYSVLREQPRWTQAALENMGHRQKP